MKTLQVGELKSKFSEVLEKVKHGEEIAISFGKKKETIAVIVPISVYNKRKKRKIGVIEKKASFKVSKGFKMTADKLLNS